MSKRRSVTGTQRLFARGKKRRLGTQIWGLNRIKCATSRLAPPWQDSMVWPGTVVLHYAIPGTWGREEGWEWEEGGAGRTCLLHLRGANSLSRLSNVPTLVEYERVSAACAQFVRSVHSLISASLRNSSQLSLALSRPAMNFCTSCVHTN